MGGGWGGEGVWKQRERDCRQVPRISREVGEGHTACRSLREAPGSRPSGRDSSSPAPGRPAGRAADRSQILGIRPGSGLTMVRTVGGSPALPAPLGLGSGEGEHRPLQTCCPPVKSRYRFAFCQDGGLEPRLQPEMARVKGRKAGLRGVGNVSVPGGWAGFVWGLAL